MTPLSILLIFATLLSLYQTSQRAVDSVRKKIPIESKCFSVSPISQVRAPLTLIAVMSDAGGD